jgi:hypothetical protein
VGFFSGDGAVRRGLLAALLLPAAGCLWDYSYDGGYRRNAATIAVPVFDNRTIRRGHELDLTNAVAREVATRTPYRIVASPADADLVVQGVLLDFSQPALVQGVTDVVVQGAVQVAVKVTVINGRTGEVVADPPPQREWASLVPGRGETLDTAKAEVFDKMAQWVVRQLEEPW